VNTPPKNRKKKKNPIVKMGFFFCPGFLPKSYNTTIKMHTLFNQERELSISTHPASSIYTMEEAPLSERGVSKKDSVSSHKLINSPLEVGACQRKLF
jgi:hypothetical protein